MSAPASRPVHPCITSITQQGSRGVEFSTWAYLTHPRGCGSNSVPNLVTASGSSLHVYSPHPDHGTLKLEASYPNIGGTICFLETLTAAASTTTSTTVSSSSSSTAAAAAEPDALLLGFGGPHARLVAVTLRPMISSKTNPQTTKKKKKKLNEAANDDEVEDEEDPALTTTSTTTTAYASTATTSATTPHLLQAVCLLDFSSVWEEHSCGSNFQEDAMFCSLGEEQQSSKQQQQSFQKQHRSTTIPKRRTNRATTVAVVLGGGVAVAVTEIVSQLLPITATTTTHQTHQQQQHGWFAREPYILPMVSLSSQLPHLRSSMGHSEIEQQQQQQQQQQNAQGTGADGSTPMTGTGAAGGLFTQWGQVLDCLFLSGYSTAETLVLLHSAPGGVTWVGRISRENTSGPPPLYLTALAITAAHHRTALLWSIPVTHDAFALHDMMEIVDNNNDNNGSSSSGLLVMGTNTITSVRGDGRIQQILAVNGWARATCPAILAKKYLKPNHPIPLALQLDGSSFCFLNDRAALVVLRRGQIYLLQRLPVAAAVTSTGNNNNKNNNNTTHYEWSLLPTGQILAGMGEVAHMKSHILVSSSQSSESSSSSSSWLENIYPKKNDNHDVAAVIKSEDPTTTTSAAMKTKTNNYKQCTAGLVIVGSRLGDSYLLGYAVDTAPIPPSFTTTTITTTLSQQQQQNETKDAAMAGGAAIIKKEEQDVRQQQQLQLPKPSASTTTQDVLDLGRILEMEDEALYAPPPRRPPPPTPQLPSPAVVSSDATIPTMTTSTFTTTTSHLIQASENEGGDNYDDDDDDDDNSNNSGTMVVGTTKRQRREAAQCSVLRYLAPLDRLVHLGPIGSSCEGPIAAPPSFFQTSMTMEDDDDDDDNNNNHDPLVVIAPTTTTNVIKTEPCGATAFIFPCGFGSSGSLALATVPGRDDRMIMSEVDCLNVHCVYSLPCSKLILLGMGSEVSSSSSNTIQILWQKKQDDKAAVWQELNPWTDPRDETMTAIVKSSVLLNACEMGRGGTFAMFLQSSSSRNSSTSEEPPAAANTDHVLMYRIAMLQWNGSLNRCDFLDEFFIRSSSTSTTSETGVHDDPVVSCTPFLTYNTIETEEERYGMAVHYASGRGVLILFSRTAGAKVMVDIDNAAAAHQDSMEESILPSDYDDDKTAADPQEQQQQPTEDEDGGDEETKLIKEFYSCKNIVALDLFRAPSHLLSFPAAPPSREATVTAEESDVTRGADGGDGGASWIHPDFDEEDMDLYGLSPSNSNNNNDTSSPSPSQAPNSNTLDLTYLAVFRQSGVLELYEVGDSDGELTLCWSCAGVERGLCTLVPSKDTPASLPLPRSHIVKVEEARFFMCGPSLSDGDNTTDPGGLRSLCLAVTTSNGDLFLYTVKRNNGLGSHYAFVLEREQLQTVVCKRTQEQARHRTKLMKKGIIPKTGSSLDLYSHFRFFRFTGISGQDGLFAALPQPKWIVSERGKPTTLNHRTRHSAPAGGKPAPVTGFCSPLPAGGFLTLHERVGRFGSQRLTMFRGISNVFERTGLLPGGGIAVEKISMGVTVRQIQFIADKNISSGSHPLYAVLVSRELEVDQSDLNDDGMTPEERARAEKEKEEARIQRQVEADLSGFDIEQEWVEEIVRDDVFQVDTKLGGAPPIQKEFYSLWIVDAADEWRVVDSYDLEEYEHGLTLQVMSLTEFKEEPGSAPSNVDMDDIHNTTFIALGTGTLNHNGEDVSSKGRVLLFEVRKVDPSRRLTSQVAIMSKTYEKDIFHGPVTSLSCLTAEGRNRLVIGAGADVNVEQWGNEKLTQVGFFRATMQILNIMLFKNFFLLSDAYDSLYFLVWRESDKSLTLLAKDYDPIPVYAAGIMSRGAAMTFLCHDDRQNLQFFQYAPGESAARGGNKLVCRADFHLGSQTTGFRQHYCRSSLLAHSATPASTVAALKQQDAIHGRTDDDQRLGVHFGTTDGRLHSIVPLSEPVYWRLAALQSVLANALESDCALSPRAWRLYRRSPRRGGCRTNDRKKGVIDGDLIVRFAELPLTYQEDLASAIGSTVELILDNLLELECSSLML